MTSHYLPDPTQNPLSASSESAVRATAADQIAAQPALMGKPNRGGLAIGVLAVGASLAALGAGLVTGNLALAGLGGLTGVVALSSTFVVGRRLYRERSIFREIFYGSRSGRLVINLHHQALMWNDAFEGMVSAVLGRPHTKDVYADFAQMLQTVPESTEQFAMLLDHVFRGGHDTIELSMKTPEGATMWYHISANPVPGWLGAAHFRIEDVTESHTINNAVYAERTKLVDFTDNAPVGFFSVDSQGRFLFANATLARWLGEDIETLMVQGRLHTYLSEAPQNAAPYDIVTGGGAKQYAEIAMKGPAGKTFQAAIRQSVVRDADGQVRTRGVVHDLTAEREMRQALQESEARFERLFDEAPLGIALVDTSGKVRDCNPALAAMLGVPLSRLQNQNFMALVEQADQARVASAFDEIKEGRTLRAPLDIFLTCDTRHVPVQLHARGFADRGVIVHLIDQTKSKQLEAQFTQSQKMQAVGQLAGGVAHDFNNLLTAMIGFCDLLLLRHKPGDPSFADIMQIKQNANRASNLVRQLLAFSRQQTLQPKVLDVTETLTELSHLLRRLIGVMIELDLHHADGIGLVKVDEGQLEQVLINLVVNARDAMNGQGHLTINTSNLITTEDTQRGADQMPAGSWVVVSVTDTGCGISRENMARIWEPFFTTKDIGKGTGLGLATVYGIVRQTGGYVHVESVVGKGTTFSVYLPRYTPTEEEQRADEKAAAATAPTADLSGTSTILLVEDEDAVRAFSSRALKNKGYNVLEAINGAAALDIMAGHQGPLDLIVTDVIMPEMDGPTFIRKVRETNTTLPVIFVSGYAEDRFKEEFGDKTHFLPKPYTLQQLAAKVKDVLAG